jgi:hypothetical protein
MPEEEHYDGCICVNGKVNPKCEVHRPRTMTETRATAQVHEFLKARKEEK